MIREYIEENIKSNEHQFDLLDKEYQAVSKRRSELKEHIRRLQEDDEIDFVIFSPRSLKYSVKNKISEYERKLQGLTLECKTLKSKMNHLMKQKQKLSQMLEESEDGRQEIKALEKPVPSVKMEDNLNKKLEQEKTERELTVEKDSVVHQGTQKHVSEEDKKIKNWNQNGTIKIKTNGDTGKFFDALEHKKGNTRGRKMGLNPELSINYNPNDGMNKNMGGFDFLKTVGISKEKAKFDNEASNPKESINTSHFIEVSEGTMDDKTRTGKDDDIVQEKEEKVIKKEDMKKIISKVELCQKLLNSNKKKCDIELKNLKFILQSMM